MNIRSTRTSRAGVALALVATLAACADDGDNPSVAEIPAETTTTETTTTETTTTETTTTETTTTETTTTATSDDASGLSDDEFAGLLWMREEEQLAHDVYVALGEEWGIRVFENISASEQQHVELTIGLLDRYGIDDPAAGNEPGTFTDPRMQELYDDLIAQGMESKVAALTVGATIEELDIADLRVRADATDEAAIDDVYARLERASRNHLRAFVGQLEMLGETYEPTILDDVDEIVSTPMQRGRDDH